MEQACGGCRHWERYVNTFQCTKTAFWGECRSPKISHDGIPKDKGSAAVTMGGSSDMLLRTGEDFVCSLWEK